jgi:signal transduction histidine kinase
LSPLSSLTNRIFLASALLAVLSIAVAVFLVNLTVTRRAEADLDTSLQEAGELVTQFQSVFLEHLVREARLIADLPRLKAAVYEGHSPTLQPVVEDYRQLVEADLFMVLNRAGAPLAVAGDAGGAASGLRLRDGVPDALAGRSSVAFWTTGDGLVQVVSIPILIDPGPEILGTLSAGVSLNRRLANRIKDLTRSEVAFVDRGRVVASTLSPERERVLGSISRREGVSRLMLGDEEFVAVVRPLRGREALARGTGASGEPPGPPEQSPIAVILRSRTEHLRFLRALHSQLAGTALVAVLLATLLGYAVARTITRPLGALTATMREMARTGNLEFKPPAEAAARWEDEDARVLTGTFQTLTESLRRFQREAAQRERLSSLGRLSTVLAHEIRNPLMIIKASLRTLRREGLDPPSAALAISDVEGEVARLNRLVNEVLDYARPIAFTYEAVSLDALCADAAHAAMEGQPTPRIVVAPGAEVGEIVTDRDRLRLVMVNLLSNARDATLQRHLRETDAGTRRAGHNPSDGPPDVEIALPPSGENAVRIEVRDRGVGILPEHLGRIFEPFFTTKRTGSGLGLAIARNIVEGLGGTITLESEPGRGTTVRLTLPRQAPRAAEPAAKAAAPASL